MGKKFVVEIDLDNPQIKGAASMVHATLHAVLEGFEASFAPEQDIRALDTPYRQHGLDALRENALIFQAAVVDGDIEPLSFKAVAVKTSDSDEFIDLRARH